MNPISTNTLKYSLLSRFFFLYFDSSYKIKSMNHRCFSLLLLAATWAKSQDWKQQKATPNTCPNVICFKISLSTATRMYVCAHSIKHTKYTQTDISTKSICILGSKNSYPFHLGPAESSLFLDILPPLNIIPLIKKPWNLKTTIKNFQHFHYPFVPKSTSTETRHFRAAIKAECLLRQNSMNALWLIKNVLDDSSEKGSEA